jgi:rhodanese-related sulfurtransferase
MNDLKPLTSAQVQLEIENGTTVLDVRSADDYEKLNIQNSINIGLDGQFAIWAATLIPLNTPIIIVAPDGKEQEAITRLARVGFDHVRGYLNNPSTSLLDGNLKLQNIKCISPEEFASQLNESTGVIDVRNDNEKSTGVLSNAHLIELDVINENLFDLDASKPYYVHCAGGYRSMIACSILKSKGFENVINIKGGMSKMKEMPQIKLTIPELKV